VGQRSNQELLPVHYENTHADFLDIKLRTIKVSELSVGPNLSSSELEVFLAPIPVLKDLNSMEKETVLIGALLHMPIVWRPNPKKTTFRVLANLRTAEICRSQLSPTERVKVLEITTPPVSVSPSEFQLLAGFISTIWHGLDPVFSRNLSQQQAGLIDRELLRRFFPELATKLGREKFLGLNRRHQTPQRQQAFSPTSQMALNVGGDPQSE